MKLGEGGQHSQEGSVHVCERYIRVSYECLTARQKKGLHEFSPQGEMLPTGFQK